MLLLLFEKTLLPRKKTLSFLSRSLSHHLFFGYLSQKPRLVVPLKSITLPCSNLFDWPNVKLSIRIRYHKHKRLLALTAGSVIIGTTGSTGEGQNEGGTTLRRQPAWWFWFRFGTELHNEPPATTTRVVLILVAVVIRSVLRQGAVTTVAAGQLPPTKLRIIVETNAKSKLLVRR